MDDDSALHVTERRLDVGGVRLRVRDYVGGGGQPLVILHGITGHAWEWHSVARILARSRRVIAVDQRGHGESDFAPPGAGYTVDELGADLDGLVRALRLEAAAVVGHSMGALAAMVAAARRPRWLSRLVIGDVGPGSLSSAWARELLSGLLEPAASARYARVEDALAEWLASDPRAQRAELLRYCEHNLVPADGGLRWRFDAPGLLRDFAASVEPAAFWQRLEQIRCPTLVLRGAGSLALPAEEAERMRRVLAHAELALVEGAGHDLAVQRPREVAASIEAFLGRSAERDSTLGAP